MMGHWTPLVIAACCAILIALSVRSIVRCCSSRQYHTICGSASSQHPHTTACTKSHQAHTGLRSTEQYQTEHTSTIPDALSQHQLDSYNVRRIAYNRIEAIREKVQRHRRCAHSIDCTARAPSTTTKLEATYLPRPCFDLASAIVAMETLMQVKIKPQSKGRSGAKQPETSASIAARYRMLIGDDIGHAISQQHGMLTGNGSANIESACGHLVVSCTTFVRRIFCYMFSDDPSYYTTTRCGFNPIQDTRCQREMWHNNVQNLRKIIAECTNPFELHDLSAQPSMGCSAATSNVQISTAIDVLYFISCRIAQYHGYEKEDSVMQQMFLHIAHKAAAAVWRFWCSNFGARLMVVEPAALHGARELRNAFAAHRCVDPRCLNKQPQKETPRVSRHKKKKVDRKCNEMTLLAPALILQDRLQMISGDSHEESPPKIEVLARGDIVYHQRAH